MMVQITYPAGYSKLMSIVLQQMANLCVVQNCHKAVTSDFRQHDMLTDAVMVYILSRPRDSWSKE